MGATGPPRVYGDEGAMLCPGALYGEPGMGPRVTAGTVWVSFTADSVGGCWSLIANSS